MAADSDLTLAATLATELGVDPADAKLPRYIAVASEAIRQYLNRRQLHYAAAYVEKVPGFVGTPRLVLGLTPLGTIASIVLPDGTTVDGSEYVVEDADAGLVYRDTGWAFTGLVQAGLLY